MSMLDSQPLVEWQQGDHHLTLLGTAHVSRASADTVRDLLSEGGYDAVAVELCPSRYQALIQPDAIAKMDLFRVFREGKALMVAAHLALGAYQKRLADQFGIQPGEEFRVAVADSLEAKRPVLLIDREVSLTLKRVMAQMPWWRRFEIISLLLASLLNREEISEDEIERLKEGDLLESTFTSFAEQNPFLYESLVAERDRYMAARLLEEMAQTGHQRMLVVVGAGHLKGIERALTEGMADPQAEVAALEALPTRTSWWKYLPWIVVAFVLAGFGMGFARSPEIGWSIVADWVLINGGLSALGALLAAAHPLTILGAFLAAPLTSLNPTVGAGMVTASLEVYLRRPSVGDFAALREDTSHWTGWWRNKVSRALLVFLFSSLGSAVGTYLAGFRIFGRLVN
jgi:pheromone shutdown-related protein TraB